MNFIFFDDPVFRNQLKPITLTRPVSEIRMGILTISEKWEKIQPGNYSNLTESYLHIKYPADYKADNFYINASVLPDLTILNKILSLLPGQLLKKGNVILAVRTGDRLSFGFDAADHEVVECEENVSLITRLPELFLKNASQISADYILLTEGRQSAFVTDKFTSVYGLGNIFIEEGVSIRSSILNAENGPIYIGKNATIQEGSLIIGPAAIGEESMVAFGAKIRPNTTLGPVCRVGGEVGNSIFMGYSNKAHDGFLGNSVIGEWCNLGANTNNSNLKNDYKEVKLYNYDTSQLEPSGEIFCGTFMGDYTKAGISTMFNTGTVVGVASNVYGADFQDKFIPSFTWGGKALGYESYRFDKAIEVINTTMGRRSMKLSAGDESILKSISDNKDKE
jgi:UDP-N-acetylglucosamine diphosphorylase / glucose-1-phosphate thymidylyltransferase / UDP-N-acetylgalactosamine diphosphorylase / glucosamine-1-phosphate N-acetyltransferase / galactosamine-1-phosphate N-acetyltransferase